MGAPRVSAISVIIWARRCDGCSWYTLTPSHTMAVSVAASQYSMRLS